MKKEPEQAEVNIGLIGHVDHGKTSITHALSGKWTDTHSEELKRGISIRLGYADAVFYKCPTCKGAEAYTTKETCPSCGKKAKKLRKVSFVDAPGHETLMTTMLSGAALMHGAILVIAANEFCPQPRTKEHLMALKLSGIKNIIVAQNKIDLVDKKKAMENYNQIENFLKEFDYTTEIIPTAAHFGTNMDLLIEAIEKHIPSPKVDSKDAVKMYVARSFDINKPGSKPKELVGGVLGGTIIQGKIKEGDTLELSPGINNQKTKIKATELNIAEGKIKEATPGGLISIRTLLDPNLTKNDQMKGNIIGKIGTLAEATAEIKMKINYFKREITDINPEVRQDETIVLSVGTATTIGNIISIKKDELEVALKVPITVEKNQNVAVSKKDGTRWRLIAYGTIQ
ncbi:translation initiation factor IF-2 subunit gamma [Candidatus Micrarchaeota archaeon]|nr:translation initiation factor IF-2 subunit gamma [Candidatus Micrarchaeota archaeon]